MGATGLSAARPRGSASAEAPGRAGLSRGAGTVRPRWRACPGGRLTRGGVCCLVLCAGAVPRVAGRAGRLTREVLADPGRTDAVLALFPPPPRVGVWLPGWMNAPRAGNCRDLHPRRSATRAPPPQAAPRHIAHLRRNRTGYNSPDARDAKENSGLDQGGGLQDVQHHPRLHIFTSPRAPVTTARPQYSAAIPPLPPVPGTPRCATRLGTPLTPGRGPESVACPQVRLQCPGRVARRTASPLLLARTSAGGRRSEWRLTKGSALLRLTIVRSERS